VIVTREGDNWLADVPEVEGTHTYARTLARLQDEVREAIALALDLPEGAEAGIELELDIHTGLDNFDKRAARLRRVRAEMEAARKKIEAETAQLAREAREANVSTRDASVMLSISSQRISQLVSG